MDDACDAFGTAHEALNHQGDFQQADLLWNNADLFKLKPFAERCQFWQYFTIKNFQN